MANEKRLIDANEIEELFYKQVELGATDLMDAFDDALQDAQTVDAVEVVHGRCDWCKTGEEKCGTCRMFFDYYGDGGSDKCSSECDSGKCAYYQPIGFCPNCGAKMDGDGNGN